VALPSLDDSQQLTGLSTADEIADFYLELGAPMVALKMGAEGALLALPGQADPDRAASRRGARRHRRRRHVRRRVPLRLLEGDDPETAARYANVAAALSTLGYGAVTPIPRRETCCS
jgi:2-dehydro-3-deoxygluconokinase